MGGQLGSLKNMFMCCVPEEYANKIGDSVSEIKNTMGNAYGGFKNMFKPQIQEEHVTWIAGSIFDSFTEGERTEKKTLNFQQVHEALTAVFNKINETIPAANCVPPSKELVDQILKDSNLDQDKLFDRQEFSDFVRKFSGHIVLQNCFGCCALHKNGGQVKI